MSCCWLKLVQLFLVHSPLRMKHFMSLPTSERYHFCFCPKTKTMAFQGHTTLFTGFLFVQCVILLGIAKGTLADYPLEPDALQLLNNLNSKVDRLESKVEVMDNKLDILLNAENGMIDGHTQISGPAQDLPVSFLSAQRIARGNNEMKYIIRLRNNSDGELVFRFLGDGDDRGPEEISTDGDGVLAVAVSSDTLIESSVLIFQVSQSNGGHHMNLHLVNRFGLSSAFQDLQNISIPSLVVNPETEAVYEPGNDLTLEVYLVPDDPSVEGLPSMAIRTTFTGVDLTTREITHYYGMDDVIVINQHSNNPHQVDATITVATAQNPISGYLSVYFDIESRGTSVVNTVQVMNAVVIRPSNQTGPFPHGYLRVLKEEYYQSSETEHESRTCIVGEECKFDCYALGETVTSISVSRILPDGSETTVPSQRNPVRILSTMQSVRWTFQAHYDSGNSEGITTFRCLAVDARTMSVASKYIDVQTALLGNIDSDRSSIAIDEDPNDPTQRRVTLSCGISGRPLPNVMFHQSSTGDVDVLSMLNGSHTVTQTGPNEGVAQKVYTLSVDELRESEGFDCQIFSYPSGNMTFHHFSVAAPDL